MTWALFFIGIALVAFGATIGVLLGAILHSMKEDAEYRPAMRIEEGENIRLIRPKPRRARVIRPQAW